MMATRLARNNNAAPKAFKNAPYASEIPIEQAGGNRAVAIATPAMAPTIFGLAMANAAAAAKGLLIIFSSFFCVYGAIY